MRLLNLWILSNAALQKRIMDAVQEEKKRNAATIKHLVMSARQAENEHCAKMLDALRAQLAGKNKLVVEKTLESSAALIRKSING